jgi:uncharacterized membrane protein
MARRPTVNPLTVLAGAFGRGLLVLVPTVGTAYTVWLVLRWIDSAIGVPIPGLGIVITLSLIVVTGFVASNVMGQAAIALLESGMKRLPVVSLLYTSLKDLLGAFVGDKKSFDKPAMISLEDAVSLPGGSAPGPRGGGMKLFGFVTCSHFDDVRLTDHVAVYLPQAYNFAGNVIIVPKSRVEYVDADPAQFLAFVVSGGVSAMSGAQTMMDRASLTSSSTR